MSDRPNYLLIQAVLDSLQLELRLLLDPPDGTKEHPATTCLELWLCHPEFASGPSHLQFIDLLVVALHPERFTIHTVKRSVLTDLSHLSVAGMYYIDPNQGSPADALLAYCSFSPQSTQTCLHPQDSQVKAASAAKGCGR